MMKTLAYGEGIYRRRIRLTGSGGVARAELEDDFHHFAVTLTYKDGVITHAVGEAIRYPWTTCPGAIDPLRRLEGHPLSRSIGAPGRALNAREQCTHLFDLASLAITHAAAGRESRQYDIEIPDRVEGKTTVRLARDRQLVLTWDLDGMTILGPPPFDSQRLGRGFVQWAEAELDTELAEAAVVLRRACSISLGRSFPLDDIPRASDLADRTLGACFTFSPEVINQGTRVFGSTDEFSDSPERLLAGSPDGPSGV